MCMTDKQPKLQQRHEGGNVPKKMASADVKQYLKEYNSTTVYNNATAILNVYREPFRTLRDQTKYFLLCVLLP